MRASSAPDRLIPLPGTFNLRDLGGYPARGAGTVRWRTLFRSDALHRIDDSGRAVLTGLNLRTVIDLRTREEAEIAPSALGDALPGGRAYTRLLTPVVSGPRARNLSAFSGPMSAGCAAPIPPAIPC